MSQILEHKLHQIIHIEPTQAWQCIHMAEDYTTRTDL